MLTASDGLSGLRLYPAGDSALVVELGQAIAPAINAHVHALDAALAAAALPGVLETIPTYRSILVHYDPLVTDAAMLGERIVRLAEASGSATLAARDWRIPVAYGGNHGIDLEAVASATGLSADEVVWLHSGAAYVVYMIGFSPGFPYLGGLPERLHLSRRSNPRLMTPAGSVMLGGMQAAISPLAMPSGWHLLGQTPARCFDLRRPEPFLFRPGDRIHFEPISAAEFDHLAEAAERGSWQPSSDAAP
jgi:KipI family sensor histidine kinase inhibitor